VTPAAPPGVVRRRPTVFPVRCRRLSVLAAWAWVAIAAAVPPAAADDLQFWSTLSLYTPTVDGWRASAEVQARWTDDLSVYNRTVFRVNGGRLVTPRLELFAGYEKTQPGTRRVRDEQRLWQQVEYTVPLGRWSIENRARIEERFVDGAAGTAARLRYRFRVKHPLGRTRWLVGASEELWVHLNTVRLAATRGMDQNRVALTAEREVSRHLSIEPGYIYIYANAPPPVPNGAAHVITLQVTTQW
jgi:hypothetical protein